MEHRTVIEEVELPLGLYAEAIVVFDYHFDKGEKATRHNPEVKPHFVIEGYTIEGVTVEDLNCNAVDCNKEDAKTFVVEWIQNNEETIIQEIAEEHFVEPY